MALPVRLYPSMRARVRTLIVAVGVSTFGVAGWAQAVYSAAGADAAAVVGAVDEFRAALGPLNANVAGSFADGRREINWDGVPDAFAAPNLLPANFFNVNSPRGVVFSTPGSGFQVSADSSNPTGTPIDFGHIDPAYPGMFEAFSPQRLFTALGSNVVDVAFFVPGGPQAALTRGFGVVFSDVDLATTTSLSFFDASSNLLGTFFAPATAGLNGGFSFLGVAYDTASVARVRIVSGNQALAPGATQGDLVVMDDFIYGEPVTVTVIPEPQTYALMLAGLGLLAWVARRRDRRRD